MPTHYKVRKGDTLYSVADDFEVPVDKLRKWNHLRGTALAPGRTSASSTSQWLRGGPEVASSASQQYSGQDGQEPQISVQVIATAPAGRQVPQGQEGRDPQQHRRIVQHLGGGPEARQPEAGRQPARRRRAGHSQVTLRLRRLPCDSPSFSICSLPFAAHVLLQQARCEFFEAARSAAACVCARAIIARLCSGVLFWY